jgi:hypothetical protein
MSEASNPAPAAPTPGPPTPIKKNYGWIYFFVFIVVASIGVTVIMIRYSQSIQLTPELLEEAEKRWRESNIKNYDLSYKTRLNLDEHWTTFVVRVRNGKVQEVRMNGTPLEKEKEEDQDPRLFHSMEAQFRYITRFLELDQKPNAPKVYFVADFDQKTGAILRYTRYDSHKGQRVEMIVLSVAEK